MRAAVGIILDTLNLGLHTVFVSTEIYDPIFPLMATTAVSNGNLA
jgi:hypothetical protein